MIFPKEKTKDLILRVFFLLEFLYNKSLKTKTGITKLDRITLEAMKE